jgi:hypothetical protein
MANWIDKVLTAYRPMYLRGLLMDGQYKLPVTAQKPPVSGKRKMEPRPAFAPERRRVLVATATAAVVSLCTSAVLTASDETAAAAPASSDTHSDKRQ